MRKKIVVVEEDSSSRRIVSYFHNKVTKCEPTKESIVEDVEYDIKWGAKWKATSIKQEPAIEGFTDVTVKYNSSDESDFNDDKLKFKVNARDGKCKTSGKNRDNLKATIKTKAVAKPKSTLVKKQGRAKRTKLASTSEEIRITRKHTNLTPLREAAQAVLQNSNATAIRHCWNAETGYHCYFCKETRVKPKDLKLHNLQEHESDIPKYMKKVCMENFFMKLDITSLSCNFCKDTFESLEPLIDHLDSKHNKKINKDIINLILPFKFDDSGVLQCCECSNIFDSFLRLQGHMNTHFPNHICTVCGAPFVAEALLKMHNTTHDTAVHMCSFCSKTFKTAEIRRNHERRHKNAPLKCKCPICNERFKDYRNKQKHLSEVHGKKFEFKCGSCDKTYFYKYLLKRHVDSNHLMFRPFKCEECDFSFCRANDLKIHMTKHTGERAYECDLCSKSFARRKTLLMHMRIHLNDKRYVCSLCGMGFVQNCSLKWHMKSKHSTEMNT